MPRDDTRSICIAVTVQGMLLALLFPSRSQFMMDTMDDIWNDQKEPNCVAAMGDDSATT